MVFHRRADGTSRAPAQLVALLLALGFLFGSFALSCWGRLTFTPPSLLGLGAVALAGVAAWRSTRNWGLQLAAITLLFSGWVMIERLDPGLALRQAAWLWVAVGARAGLLWWRPDLRKLEGALWPLGLSILALQAAVFTFGTERHGAKNWIIVGPMSIQPSEFVKLLFVLFMAAFFCRFRPWVRVAFARDRSGIPHWSVFALGAVAAAVEATLVYQKDLGMALLLGLIFAGVFYVATGRADLCGLAFCMAGLGAWAAYMAFYHVRERFYGWLDPFIDPKGVGYQSVQSLYALSSGGFTGRGWGLGQPWLVPEAPTDFISVAFVEELGLLGLLALLLLLAVVVAWCFGVAFRCPEEFGAFVATGLGLSFAAQTLVVVGGCMRLLPLTGMTLPFLSYGGSSLLASMIALALLEVIDDAG